MTFTMKDRDQDTICALATPRGYSGIAVVRLSGRQSFSILGQLAKKTPGFESHTIKRLQLFDSSGSKMDDVLVSFFADGKSFTGEESVEINCHGNPLIIDQVLSACISLGARAADNGEFSYRAFMNGKIDLLQAESVMSIVHSESPRALKSSLKLLDGELSKIVTQSELLITKMLAHLEASIDFSEEGLVVLDHSTMGSSLEGLMLTIDELVGSYRSGKVIQQGLDIAIVGSPNSGKSSILNLISQQDSAIVTDIPGTTRDPICVSIIQDGLKVNYWDTAGIRESLDLVESLGIKRTLSIAEKADLVLYVVAGNDPSVSSESGRAELRSQITSLQNTQVVGIVNKIDVANREQVSKVTGFLQELLGERNMSIQISAMSSQSRSTIMTLVSQFIVQNRINSDSMVLHARHFELLSSIKENLSTARSLLDSDPSPELLSIHLKECLLSCYNLLGKRFDDQIIDKIFKEFCLGK